MPKSNSHLIITEDQVCNAVKSKTHINKSKTSINISHHDEATREKVIQDFLQVSFDKGISVKFVVKDNGSQVIPADAVKPLSNLNNEILSV